MGKWTQQELTVLINLWPHVLRSEEISKYLPSRTPRSIDLKARKINIIKIPEISKQKKILRAQQQAIFNKTVLGRDLSDENLKSIALNYSSKSHFLKCDGSAYATARDRGLLESICAHMITHSSSNFPQTFLFELLKLIFPNELIRYNDRKAIYPKEIDIYFPGKKLGFEYDGINFHSNKEWDINKDNLCHGANITLIRIKEINKADPIPGIVQQLSKHLDFDVGLIPLAKEKTMSSFISKEDIKKLCKSYNNFTEFFKYEKKCVNLLKKNNLLEEYTSHMKKYYLTDEENCILIKNAINTSANKSEMINNHWGVYSKLFKNKTKFKELYDLYKLLPSKRSPKIS